MTEDTVLIEDQGTNSGLSDPGDGDFLDAANFGSYLEAAIQDDFVIRGLTLSNVSGGTFDLSAGKVAASAASADQSSEAETRDQRVAYVAEIAGRTGLAYTQGSLNYVFVDIVLGNDDEIAIEVNTTDTAPSDPSVKIAEIDDT